MSTGVELIAAERKRQITEEGYDAEHDLNGDYQLAMAGASYALPAAERRAAAVPATWPWLSRFWKPTPDDRVRELTKAGALIAAAIDSLIA
jgi:hypothetical protein